MALVNCTQCGQPISEHAATCPHCGAPVKPLAKPFAKQADDNEVTRPVVEYHNDVPARKGSNKGALVAIIAVLLLLLAGGGLFYLHQQEQQRLAEEQAIEQARREAIAAVEAAEQARRDAIAAAEAAEQALQDSIEALHQAVKEAYLAKVRSTIFYDDTDLNGYYLFDISGDGIPELWITTGTDMGDHKLLCYKYNKGKLTNIYEAGGHSDFSRGSNYVLLVGMHNGGEWAVKLSYKNGRIVEKELINNFHEDVEEFFEISQLKEPPFKWISKSNLKPIENMF